VPQNGISIAVDILGMSNSTVASISARPGRPCGVCALSSHQRTALETALAQGVPVSRISRQDWAPGRDSIRHHLQSGHLRTELQEQAERAQGLDYTTVVARISEIAQRARTTALEAAEAADRAGVLRAGDCELRALSALAVAGETSEHEIATRAARRDVSAAVIRVARRDAATAEVIAMELDAMYRPILAEEVREQVNPEIERQSK
jgi:hypothetical protein